MKILRIILEEKIPYSNNIADLSVDDQLSFCYAFLSSIVIKLTLFYYYFELENYVCFGGLKLYSTHYFYFYLYQIKIL